MTDEEFRKRHEEFQKRYTVPTSALDDMTPEERAPYVEFNDDAAALSEAYETAKAGLTEDEWLHVLDAVINGSEQEPETER